MTQQTQNRYARIITSSAGNVGNVDQKQIHNLEV